mmetsp:Transcript_15626/g.51582  ORF Transcript_15626/g.51582 Transcript_15626/m.51582 type:complete len:296 (+) Transcript_15626:60-947(+)
MASEQALPSPERGRTPKFKRSKISRPQLLVLTQHFESDPLPSFEKRQALAQQLDMTPRSVQIWFQNRRQRLLKPQRQAEGAEASQRFEPASGDDAVSEAGSSSSSSSHSLSQPDGVRLPLRPTSGTQYPMMAAHLASLLGLREGISGGGVVSALAQLGAAQAACAAADGGQPQHPGMPPRGDNLSAGAALLLAHALQQQLAGMAASQPVVEPPAAVQRIVAARPAEAAGEGVDGLLLLSACADAQVPASPSSSASSTASATASSAASPAASPAASAPPAPTASSPPPVQLVPLTA